MWCDASCVDQRVPRETGGEAVRTVHVYMDGGQAGKVARIRDLESLLSRE